MRLRFTLSHADSTPSSLVINEPGGWKECKLKLERDPNFHSLVQYFEGTFIFYGDNGTENGGINYIKSIEQNFGFNADISITVEGSYDDVNYTSLFTGLLDLVNSEEMENNKMMVPIIPDSIWTKMINRMNTPVDIKSATTLDGDAATVFDNIDLRMTSQLIRYSGDYFSKETFSYENVSENSWLQIDFDGINVDDLNKFSLPRTVIGRVGDVDVTDIAGIFEAPYDGEFTIDFRLETGSIEFGDASYNYVSSGTDFTNPVFYISIQGTTTAEDQEIPQTIVNYSGQYVVVHEGTYTFNLLKGQQITIKGVTAGYNVIHTVFGSVIYDWKTDCKVATTGPITLSGEQTIDSEDVDVGDRVLVKNQSDPRENGIYIVASGAWLRATDANLNNELENAKVRIEIGNTNGGLFFYQRVQDSIIGTTSIIWEAREIDYTYYRQYPGTTPDSHLIITADTTFPETTTESFFLHDVFGQIFDRITNEPGIFYSEFLGGEDTKYRQYDSNGCGYRYVNFKGLQARQYTLAEKPFFQSLRSEWDGANPILNLALGEELIEDEPKLVIREKHEWYNPEISLNFSNVRIVGKTYENDLIFKIVKNGYKKWQAEDISGNDTPQTVHTRATILDKSGEEIDLRSEFIASDILIESTRRDTRFLSKDNKFDNDTFIVSINPTAVSTDLYVPELSENFTSISNLLNEDYRYNLRITPVRNFGRWLNYLSGCLQNYLSSTFKFVSGEGNYDLITNYEGAGDGCLGTSELGEFYLLKAENANIEPVTDILHIPILYEMTIPMELEEYYTISLNRKNAIGISQTDEDHVPFFIKELTYDINKGQAEIKAWPLEYFDIQVIDTAPEMLNCDPFEGIITEDGFSIITEDGENLILE